MTRNEFIEEAKGLPPGTMTIVSGKSADDVRALLDEAKAAIESVSKQALVYDCRETVAYPERGYQQDTEEARLFEFVKVVSEGFVVLVGNEFDRDSVKKRTVEIDVVMDIMDTFKVRRISRAYSRNVTEVREIWPFMDRLYWYDVGSDTVTFVKSQDAFR